MKNQRLILVVLGMFITNLISAQQFVFKGRVLDFDTHLPISCARVEMSSCNLDTIVSTNQKGEFSIAIDCEVYLDVFIYMSYYDDYYADYDLDDEEDVSIDSVFYLQKEGSGCYVIEDIAEEDAMDITFGFDLYSPNIVSTDDKFKTNFSVYMAYDWKLKLANNLQFGIKYTELKLKWMAMNNDTLITTIPHIKERYFEASTSLFLYTRYIMNTGKKSGQRGAFVDVGIGYTLPYYFAYTYFGDVHTKTTINRIHNFKDFEAMLRIGYYWGSINATYRFTDILKENYIQPPPINIGIEFNIPATM